LPAQHREKQLESSKMKFTYLKYLSVVLLLTFSFCVSSSDADVIFLDNTMVTGDALDELDLDDLLTAAATVPTEIPGLSLTVEGIGSSADTFDLNSTGTSLGVNSDGDADTDAFEAAFAESVTFSFNQDVTISQLDFAGFAAGDVFEFAGVSITNGDLSNGTTDVFDFATPLALAAGQSFTLTATSGTVGIEGIHTTPAVPEPTSAVLLGLAGLGLCVRRRR